MFGMPGIDGSMGVCAFCGDSFLVEVCLGKKIATFKLDSFDDDMCAHEKCFEQMKAMLEVGGGKFDALELPEKSPIRRAYEEAIQKQLATHPASHLGE
jgi:hypothetical protein